MSRDLARAVRVARRRGRRCAIAASPPRERPSRRARRPTPPCKYSKTTECVTAANTRSTLKNGVSWAQTAARTTPRCGRSADKGAGQTVAVIDTGVNPVLGVRRPAAAGRRLRRAGRRRAGRLRRARHGRRRHHRRRTRPRQRGFAGVAPDADDPADPAEQQLLRREERQARLAGQRRRGHHDQPRPTRSGTPSTSGANVINISEASCRNGDASRPTTGRVQSRDVDYAVRQRRRGRRRRGQRRQRRPTARQQNTPGARIRRRSRRRPRCPGVLAVGAVDQNGDPAAFSLAGPWVDVAAPGVDIISTNPLPRSTGPDQRVHHQSGRHADPGHELRRAVRRRPRRARPRPVPRPRRRAA